MLHYTDYIQYIQDEICQDVYKRQPIRLAIDFKTTAMAELVAQLPMVERVNGTEVDVICQDMTEVECASSAITGLAGIA